MKILYPNLNILDIRCDGRDKKEQCSCISTVVPSKPEWLVARKRKQHNGMIGILIAYWRVIYNEELEIKQGR